MTWYIKRFSLMIFIGAKTHDYLTRMTRNSQIVWHKAEDNSYTIGGISIWGRFFGFDWGLPF